MIQHGDLCSPLQSHTKKNHVEINKKKHLANPNIAQYKLTLLFASQICTV